jgi:hypothetical protein
MNSNLPLEYINSNADAHEAFERLYPLPTLSKALKNGFEEVFTKGFEEGKKLTTDNKLV